MHQLSDLTPTHLDLLKEAGNIGAAHAATALSTLLHERIEMNVPSVTIMPMNELMKKDAEKYVAATFIEVTGGLKGCYVMIFGEQQANSLISRLIPSGTVDDGGMGSSAFCEISNILCGSYLSAISSMLDTRLIQSPPDFAVDMEGAILGEALNELSLYDDSVLMIDTALFHQEQQDKLSGEFLFMPYPGSLDLIFSLAAGETSL
ncbi:chemotaxis protein CheC [Sporolactobacillus vineae]|uniref:chemotaxis protein CheC n=1 Tax=Sporolactobacillus vineae TaxID=444463 RepID=UPI0002885666|nr:chemotaxis protein CheC [Sporolactobacillus vineae]